MSITVDTHITVYPEINFRDYVLKQLGSEFSIRGIVRKYLVKQVQRTGKFSRFFPKYQEIARIEQDAYWNCDIRVTILKREWIETIKELAASYHNEYEERKKTLGAGYTTIYGNIEWHLSYSETARRRKRSLIS